MILPFESQIPSQLQIRWSCSSFLRRGKWGQESLQCIFKQKSCLRPNLEAPGKEERPMVGVGVCVRGAPLCTTGRVGWGRDRNPGVPYKVGWKEIAHTSFYSDKMVTGKQQGWGGDAGWWKEPWVQAHKIGDSRCCDREAWEHDGDPVACSA